jgi:hypothetical protein
MSTTVRAKLCVSGGGALQDKAGDESAPSQLNAFGIAPAFSKLALFRTRAGVPSPGGAEALHPASIIGKVSANAARRRFARGNLGKENDRAKLAEVCTVPPPTVAVAKVACRRLVPSASAQRDKT